MSPRQLVSVRLPEPLLQELRLEAQEREISLSEALVRRLEALGVEAAIERVEDKINRIIELIDE